LSNDEELIQRGHEEKQAYILVIFMKLGSGRTSRLNTQVENALATLFSMLHCLIFLHVIKTFSSAALARKGEQPLIHEQNILPLNKHFRSLTMADILFEDTDIKHSERRTLTGMARANFILP